MRTAISARTATAPSWRGCATCAGVTIAVWRVYDDQVVAWRTQMGGRDPSATAHPLLTTSLAVDAPSSQLQDLRIPLDQVLPAGQRGEGVYRLEIQWRWADATVQPPIGEDPTAIQRSWRQGTCIVSLSDLGLQAHLRQDGIDCWCWSLASTLPVAGTHLRVYSSKAQLLAEGDCDAGGWLHLSLPSPAPEESVAMLTASRAAQDAAPAQLSWLDFDAQVRDPLEDTSGRPWLGRGLEAFVYGERGVWRPGETVHLHAVWCDLPMAARLGRCPWSGGCCVPTSDAGGTCQPIAMRGAMWRWTCRFQVTSSPGHGPPSWRNRGWSRSWAPAAWRSRTSCRSC